MRRREFITLISGVVVAWPFGASAQPAKKPVRIGLLPFGSPSNAYDQSLVEVLGVTAACRLRGRAQQPIMPVMDFCTLLRQSRMPISSRRFAKACSIWDLSKVKM